MLTEAGLAGGMKILDIGSGAVETWPWPRPNSLNPSGSGRPGGGRGRQCGDPGNGSALASRELGTTIHRIEWPATPGHWTSRGSDFDALIGRFVLMYLADPTETLKHLATRVRPGGIVAVP